MQIKKIVVIGLGEIGSSWYRVASELGVDLIGIDVTGNKERLVNKKDAKGKTIMHICLPYIKDFDKVCANYIKQYNPDLVIVNTSAEVGATSKLYSLTKTNMVHVPVRGVHPNIDKGIKTFENAIGPVNKESDKLAKEYLDALKIKHISFTNSDESEMAKLLDTSYYGWNILFAKEVHKMCEKYNMNYDNVYTRFNETYNKGYIQLGKPNVVRPVLLPPQVFNKKLGLKDNKINGHCVRTNWEILKKMQKPTEKTWVDHAITLDDKD